MKLSFFGATKEVTGSNFLLETEEGKILIDCGLFQGGRHAEEKNYQPFPYSPKEIDFLLVTHSHIDHIGRIPKLVKEGFNGKIYCTRPVKDFAEIFLEDCANIIKEEAEELKIEPLFTQEDVENCLQFFHPIDYHQEIKLSENVSFVFKDAGHILGSAFIEIFAFGKKIVFSGDLGNPPVPLLAPTEFTSDADYLIIESTYGSRIHESPIERKLKLERAIEDTVAQKGVLLIPSFAMERTQELLYELNDLVEHFRVPRVPIFLDSPLAIKATEIYKKYPDYFNKEAFYLIKSGDDLFKFPGLKFTPTVEESKKINEIPPPKVIIAGSGMSTAGRILFHEKLYLSDPKNLLLIIGYQVSGTLGRKIFDGAQEVKILGEKVKVQAKVKAIGAYSAHADQPKLVYWVRKAGRVKRVFIVHGEEDSATALACKIRDELGIATEVPDYGSTVELT